ncbi:MAG: hypothetical protein MUF36_11705 [Bacteroidales bacterium]|jgi:hypothetical protein|nr:hypothetical protein [Bacteroidales bacterium]
MKRIITTAVLILIICTATFAKKTVAEGKTYTTLGDYRIEKAENPVNINGKECKAFKISYENTPMEVTVIVMKDRKTRKYLVVSDKLSIQYAWNEHYFGVGRIDKALNSQGFKTTDENLNRAEYFHQRVLGPGLLMDGESTRMIAAFFPLLLTPDENMVAAK